tara:strand:- start:2405 stop:3361 length:957 start_codon:yes stop_codon:yes gene_type:complete
MLADKLMSAVPSAASSRGLFPGGAGYLTNIDYIEISTPGNASDFGDCTAITNTSGTSNGSSDRGIWGSGAVASDTYTNVIEYVTISTPGNTTDFGDLGGIYYSMNSTSNGTNERGVWAGGYLLGTGTIPYIMYVTISTPGNSATFGNLIAGSYGSNKGCSNGTNERGVFFIGAGTNTNSIDYITISSTSNSSDFGDLISDQGPSNNKGAGSGGATSNTTGERGVYFGGIYDVAVNVIQYVTINSTGNCTDFGDLTNADYSIVGTSSGASGDTAVVAPMNTGSANASINYFTISTTGNAANFGDLVVARNNVGACSNAD